jgi:hypothetical protein
LPADAGSGLCEVQGVNDDRANMWHRSLRPTTMSPHVF